MSLLEMLVALTLTAAVALLAWTILQTAAFHLRDRSERIGVEHALRVASTAARAALEPLGRDSTAGADLTLPGPDGFISRAIRGSGVLCSASPTALTVRGGQGWWYQLRAPVGGRDSILIGTVVGPDRWIAVGLGANAIPGSCPDGAPALILAASVAPGDLPAVGSGSPLRLFEPMELRAYSSAGAGWLGMRSMSSGGSIQPLAGPFPGAGVQFTYFSRTGSLVTVAGLVARAGMAIEAVTERAGGVGIARVAQQHTDSVSAAVLLRNAR